MKLQVLLTFGKKSRGHPTRNFWKLFGGLLFFSLRIGPTRSETLPAEGSTHISRLVALFGFLLVFFFLCKHIFSWPSPKELRPSFGLLGLFGTFSSGFARHDHEHGLEGAHEPSGPRCAATRPGKATAGEGSRLDCWVSGGAFHFHSKPKGKTRGPNPNQAIQTTLFWLYKNQRF